MELSNSDIRRFWSKIEIKLENECWNWIPKPHKTGYSHFRVKNKIYKGNRIAWIITNGDIPEDKPYILHSCHNKRCCNPNHLRAGTQQENMDDMYHAKRNNHPGKPGINSKLTKEQVVNIFSSILSQRELAIKYSVSQSTISEIKCGATWSHLTGKQYTKTK